VRTFKIILFTLLGHFLTGIGTAGIGMVLSELIRPASHPPFSWPRRMQDELPNIFIAFCFPGGLALLFKAKHLGARAPDDPGD
jgi:hypothetical protein